MREKAQNTSPAPSEAEWTIGLSDAELIEAVASGNRWVAGRLYERLHGVVDRTLRRILHGRQGEFDDLVQITFEQIIRGLAGGRLADQSKLSAWAASIATHVAFDAVRRRIRERALFSPTEVDVGELPERGRGSPERQMEARFDIHRIHGVLSRMNADQAEALLLYDVLGYGVVEIAAITGVAAPAAQSRLRRARLELLRRMKGEAKR